MGVLCKFVGQQGCSKGETCEWAHSQEEVEEASKPWKCVFCGYDNSCMNFICGGMGPIGVTPGCKKHRNVHNREMKSRFGTQGKAMAKPTGVHALPSLLPAPLLTAQGSSSSSRPV